MRAGQILLGDLAVALICHAHIAPQRNRGDHVFSVVLALPANQGPSEADREPQDFHTRTARHPEMTVFMKRHDDGKGCQRDKNSLQGIEHRLVLGFRASESTRYKRLRGLPRLLIKCLDRVEAVRFRQISRFQRSVNHSVDVCKTDLAG